VRTLTWVGICCNYIFATSIHYYTDRLRPPQPFFVDTPLYTEFRPRPSADFVRFLYGNTSWISKISPILISNRITCHVDMDQPARCILASIQLDCLPSHSLMFAVHKMFVAYYFLCSLLCSLFGVARICRRSTTPVVRVVQIGGYCAHIK
jgi:hypothetical protein